MHSAPIFLLSFPSNCSSCPLDVVILVLYFVVIVIGFYTEDSRYTSKEYLLSNGKKSTWTAGSSSASTNLCLSSWDGQGRPTNMASSQRIGIGSERFGRCAL